MAYEEHYPCITCGRLVYYSIESKHTCPPRILRARDAAHQRHDEDILPSQPSEAERLADGFEMLNDEDFEEDADDYRL